MTVFCYYLPHNMSSLRAKKNGPISTHIAKAIRECPLCQKKYTKKDLHVVDQEDSTELVHARCPKCNHAIMAFVVQSEKGLSSIGMLTDLNAVEASKLTAKKPITEDQLFSFHETLTHNQKDFIYLVTR